MRRRDSLFRPFEILKLIRDGVIRNVHDLRRSPDSWYHLMIREFETRVSRLGLIDVDGDGNVKTTTHWDDFASALTLSLSQLSPYNRDSVVCAPIFGPPKKPPTSAEILVLMPFSNEMKPVYDDHIKKVANGLGLAISRADDFFTADSVMGEVWNAINACRIVIADCTNRNPNVFYEIGVAHTLGKPVILVAQTMNDIPFDVKHLRTIVYEFNPRGMQKFEAALLSTLEYELEYHPISLEDFISHERMRNQA